MGSVVVRAIMAALRRMTAAMAGSVGLTGCVDTECSPGRGAVTCGSSQADHLRMNAEAMRDANWRDPRSPPQCGRLMVECDEKRTVCRSRHRFTRGVRR